MESPCLRGTSLPMITARIAAAVLVLAFALPAVAQRPNPAAAKVAEYSADPNATKISLSLLEIADGVKKRKFTLRNAPGNDMLQYTPKGDGLLVDVICTRLNGQVLKKFALPNTRVRDVSEKDRWVVVEVYDLDDLNALAAIPEVGMIKPQYKPLLQSAGVADSRADRALGTAGAIGVTGAGVQVGILSDSFARTDLVRDADTQPAPGLAGTLTGARNQDSGDLPAQVQILRDDWVGKDEGAAMAELVHDIAPGATISFHTAIGGQPVFADGIGRLRSNGARIIVDDVVYFEEPFYQDGVVARAATSAVNAGAAYFSAAGNFGDSGLRQTYRDVNPSQDETVRVPTGKDLHDWGGGNAFLPIYLPQGGNFQVVMQWNQPFWSVNPTSTPRDTAGSQLDFDLYLIASPLNSALAAPLASSRNAQGTVGVPLGDAFETLSYTAPTTQTVFLCVDHYQGYKNSIPQSRSVPVEFRMVFVRLGNGVSVQGMPSSPPAPTIFGHALASGVVSVGAVPWWESPFFRPDLGPTQFIDPEPFSSRGGNVPVPFDSSGRLKSSVQRTVYAPTLAGVDANSTTFFPSDWASSGTAPDDNLPPAVKDPSVDPVNPEPDNFPNFFGTSAAAPNVAAVAALLKSQDQTRTPAQIRERLTGTAVDVTGLRAAVGRDDVTGFGLVNGEIALVGDSRPNITFFRAQGWGGAVVINQTPGSLSDAVSLVESAPIYVNFGITNKGVTPVTTTFQTQIFVDANPVPVASIPTSSLATNGVFTQQNINIGTLPAGQHTIRVVTDATGVVNESNETDNEVVRQITVLDNRPNLTFAPASGWPQALLVNQTPGLLSDAAQFSANRNTYVNYSVINNGLSPFVGPFSTAIFLDNVFVSATPKPDGLGVNAFWTQQNIDLGLLAPGPHQIRIVTDYLGAPNNEGSELDNEIVKNITVASPPPNDNFSSLITLSCPYANVTGTNLSATKQPGEPFHAGNRGGASVWYRIITPAVPSGRPLRLEIDTVGSDFNTLLAVYSDIDPPFGGFGGLEFVAANDDIVPGSNTASKVAFEARTTAPTAYYIVVDGYNGAEGNFVLRFNLAVPNDNFLDRMTLTGNAGTVSGINLCASKELGEPNHGGSPGGKSLWWRWVAPSSGMAQFSTAGSRFDTTLAAYVGNAVTALTLVAQNDDSGPGNLTSAISFPVTAGVEYNIAVDGFGPSDVGNLVLSWSSGGANDFFGAPTVLPFSCEGTVQSSNLNATQEPDEPALPLAGNPGGKSVWFQWVSPELGIGPYPVTFDTVGSSFDTIMGVYRGFSIDSLTLESFNNDINPARNPGMKTSRVTFIAAPNTAYAILVDGAGNPAQSGSVMLNWSLGSPPLNDFLSGPIFFPSVDEADRLGDPGTTSVTYITSTRAASIEPGEPNHALQPGKRSTWFRILNEDNELVANKVRLITVEATAFTTTTSGCPPSAPFDTLIGVYVGPDGATSFGQLSPLAFNDDRVPGVNTNSRVIFVAPPTQQAYYIAVDGKNGSSGNYTLYIESRPAPATLKKRVGQITEEELQAALEALNRGK